MKVRGYALPLVLAILGITATALGVLLTVVSSSAQISGDMIKRRKVFYACDGIQRSIVQLGNEYLRSDSTPTPAEMQTNIESNAGGAALPLLTPANFTVDNFTVNFDPTLIQTSPIPNGPFTGMNAQQTPVSFELEASYDGTNIRCRQKLEATLGQIGLFQFLVFSDINASLDSGAGSYFDGRVHINGDMCLEGNGMGGSNSAPRVFNQGPYIRTLTSGARVLHAADGRCEARFGRAGEVGVPNGDPSDGTVQFRGIEDAADHGCTNCNGSGQSWREYAINRWNNNVLDVDHDVPQLRLPVAASTQAQMGWSARVQDTSAAVSDQEASNNGTARFLVDRPLPTDSDEVRAERYACKSDLRIINGVWYLKALNPPDNCGWPGTAIWSDHVENGGVVDGLDLFGQDQLDVTQGWGGAAPSGYSYYERASLAAGATNIAENTAGVISYGTLYETTGLNDTTTRWVPGHFADAGGYNACVAGAADNGPDGDNDFYDATQGPAGCVDLNLINATRSGFGNGHAQATAPVNPQLRGKILPINFDVAEFQNQLANMAPGELGSAFGGRTFNGIIYITSSWPGQLNGFAPSGHPTPYPNQGQTGAAPDPALFASAGRANGGTTHYKQNVEPVSALCTAGGGVAIASDGTESFTAPDCATTSTSPNAVRVINGRNINFQVFPTPGIATGQLPGGLTIATNLPFYVLGDYNRSSSARNPAANQTGVPAPWVPVAVVGDQAHLLSNDFKDYRADWSRMSNSNLNRRCATQTTHNLAMLSGSNVSRDNFWDGGIHNFPRYLEDWRCGAPESSTITGSFVIAHHPVFSDHTYSLPGFAYGAAVRDWMFDTHFNIIDNQPPGTPVFDVGAIRRWSRW